MKYRRRRSSAEAHPTAYARALRLRHTHPGSIVCFLLFEGSVGFAVLLALAELVNWWAVILLPLTVAMFVKINDLVAGVFSRTDVYRRGRTTVLRPVIWARGVATVPTAMPIAMAAAPGASEPATGTGAGWTPAGPPSAVYGVSFARRNDDAWVGTPVTSRPAGHRRATNQRPFVTAAALHQPGGVTR